MLSPEESLICAYILSGFSAEIAIQKRFFCWISSGLAFAVMRPEK